MDSSQEGIDPRIIIGALIHRWYIFPIVMIPLVAGIMFYHSATNPTYTSTADIYVYEQQHNLDTYARLIELSGGGASIGPGNTIKASSAPASTPQQAQDRLASSLKRASVLALQITPSAPQISLEQIDAAEAQVDFFLAQMRNSTAEEERALFLNAAVLAQMASYELRASLITPPVSLDGGVLLVTPPSLPAKPDPQYPRSVMLILALTLGGFASSLIIWLIAFIQNWNAPRRALDTPSTTGIQ